MQPQANESYIDQSAAQQVFATAAKTMLERTQLWLEQKTMLSASALANCDEHGAKSELARHYGVSRPTVYSAMRTACSVLTEHFDEQESKTALVEVDEVQLHRAVVALRVMAPNALRRIEELIGILYPGVHVCYGRVQQMVSEAEQRAKELNSKMDMSRIEAGALDEMFSQGDPVLAGVDLDTGALFALSLRQSRSAEDWAEVLEACKTQGLHLRTAVKDAARGIEAATTQVYPEAEQRDDCFHAHYEMGKVRRCLEQRAYGAIHREQEAKQDLENLRRTGRGPRRSKLVHHLVRASRQCQQAMELHDTFESAMHTAQEAMEIVDLKTGLIRSAQQSQATIEQAARVMMGLNDDKCQRVGKYLRNRAAGLARYMVQLNEQLAQLMAEWSKPAVSLACVFWRLLYELKYKRFRRGHTRERHQQQLLSAYARLCDSVLCQADREAIIMAVDSILERRHRASSAIEGFNAALRPFLYVHKGVTQGFLELFRAYYNLRTRRWGRHKGTSAYECLSGQRVEDWLSYLGYPPKAALQ